MMIYEDKKAESKLNDDLKGTKLVSIIWNKAESKLHKTKRFMKTKKLTL
jgi:hypothetical protein